MRSLIRVAVASALGIGSATACAQQRPPEPLQLVADLPLPGHPVRFDYQSLDTAANRLYIAHMNDDRLLVVDVAARSVIAHLEGFDRVHGVWAVPALGRLFASVTGRHEIAVVDMASLKVLHRVGPVVYPDGLAYAPTAGRLFISDEHGQSDAVLDVASYTMLPAIPLGGDAGNTVFDSAANRIMVAVHTPRELVTINPATAAITGHFPLPELEEPHGIALDMERRLAFVAGEGNAKLAVVDLNTMRVTATYPVAPGPDVLAFDPLWHRLYVASESGAVTVFTVRGATLELDGTMEIPHAHTVAVDPRTHLVYLPLENIDGRPVLRIMRATPPRPAAR